MHIRVRHMRLANSGCYFHCFIRGTWYNNGVFGVWLQCVIPRGAQSECTLTPIISSLWATLTQTGLQTDVLCIIWELCVYIVFTNRTSVLSAGNMEDLTLFSRYSKTVKFLRTGSVSRLLETSNLQVQKRRMHELDQCCLSRIAILVNVFHRKLLLTRQNIWLCHKK